MDCFRLDFRSYPPISITIGTVGVAMGVMKAVQQAADTSVRGPAQSTSMLAHKNGNGNGPPDLLRRKDTSSNKDYRTDKGNWG